MDCARKTDKDVNLLTSAGNPVATEQLSKYSKRKLVKLPIDDGKVPIRELVDKSRFVKLVKRPIEDGIVPYNPLEEYDKDVNDGGNPDITLLIAVFKLVLARLILVKLVTKASAVGKLPVNVHKPKSRYTSFVSFATKLGNLVNLDPYIDK